MKRRATSSLTGGTRDVNPQFISGCCTQAAADTTLTKTFPLPKNIHATSGRATVIEVLKVICLLTNPQPIANVAETPQYVYANFSTANHAATEAGMHAADVFATFYRFQQGAWTAAGSYGFAEPEMVQTRDITDGAGHGILVATDNFYVQVGATGTGVANSAYFKLLYRFKTVPLVEYIGIVQSQQAVSGS